MSARPGWQAVMDEAMRRIRSREWAPGDLIPNEEELAAELGLARATVNRALRELAAQGYLERRRRAGTRVAIAPSRHARLTVPILREEIEGRGLAYGHALLSRDDTPPPPPQRLALGLSPEARVQRIEAMHMADGRPHAHELRWVNLDAMPGFAEADLGAISANEWLVTNAPFAHGTFDYSAEAASAGMAAHLGCETGAPVMVLERVTHGTEAAITWVRLTYTPGWRLRMEI